LARAPHCTGLATISNVSATDVAVSVGSNGNGGGLVGLNTGSITNASATGDVTGAAGTNGFTTLGGLAAVNLGSISSSFASVAAGGLNVANLQAGGVAGSNSGTILSSVATGPARCRRRGDRIEMLIRSALPIWYRTRHELW
jgi:The GLUG motif